MLAIEVPSACLFSLMDEMLNNNKSVIFSPNGNSMQPFLFEGLHTVEIKKSSFQELKISDVVLIRRTNGDYVMHRLVYKNRHGLYLNGDNQNWFEGPLPSSALVAVGVARICKGERWEFYSFTWRCLSWIWILLFPIRYLYIRVLNLFLRLRGT